MADQPFAETDRGVRTGHRSRAAGKRLEPRHFGPPHFGQLHFGQLHFGQLHFGEWHFAARRPASRRFPKSVLSALCATSLSVAAATLDCGDASAGGFFIVDQSSAGLGRAYAGQAAIANDPSTIFFNPAGMTELKERGAMTGANVIVPRIQFRDTGTTATTPGSGGVPVAAGGNDGGDPTKPTVVPHLYGATPVGAPGASHSPLWFGLGVTVPFGLSTDYEAGWFGRYSSTVSRLTVFDVAPSAAFRVNSKLSLGGGVDFQTSNATLGNALPAPLQAGGPSPSTDGAFRAHGTGVAVGFNAGILYKPVEALHLGLHYRSAISHELDGRALFSGLTGPLAGLNGNVGFKGDLNLPDIVTAAASYAVGDRLTLLGDVMWFGWSRFKEIRFRFDDGRADAVSPTNYRDTWAAAVGAEYAPTKAWRLRTGFQCDQTPTVSQFRDTRIPDGNRYFAAVGASYTIRPGVTTDFGYAHVFVTDGAVNVTTPFYAGTAAASSVTTSGISANGVDIFVLGLHAAF